MDSLKCIQECLYTFISGKLWLESWSTQPKLQCKHPTKMKLVSFKFFFAIISVCESVFQFIPNGRHQMKCKYIVHLAWVKSVVRWKKTLIENPYKPTRFKFKRKIIRFYILSLK